MSTFLQLVNKVEENSGTVDTRSSPTVDVAAPATLRQQKIVNWVRDAWMMIQSGRNDWRFMRGEFSHALVIGQARYTAAELGLTDHSQWCGPLSNDPDPMACYDPAIGGADRQAVHFLRWDSWRNSYGSGAVPNNRLVHWSIDYDNSLCVGPAPDRAWVMTGEYIRAPQELTANATVPRIAAQFHDIIVYRALMLLADHDESPQALIPATAKFAELYRQLVNASTEPLTF